MTKNELKLSDAFGNYFQITAGNATVKITKKQFAELSEQVFEYWRITIDQVAEQSTATDAVAHFKNLKTEEN
jgi:hypothetical protein